MKGRLMFQVFSGLLTLAAMSSCGINSNVMFKTPKGETVTGDKIPMNPEQEYRISVDDKLTFRLFTNDGEQLLNSTIGENTVINPDANFEYLVRKDSTANFPKIGTMKVAGLTVSACEALLVTAYSSQFNEPYVKIQITNQRVVVFPGDGGDAVVIVLENNNTTLMEAIALAGGITERGKAKSIKLMRRVGGERKVYEIDLSTIDGLKYADMIVQANDYIYVEPDPQVVREVVKDAAPVVSILSSLVVLLTVFNFVK